MSTQEFVLRLFESGAVLAVIKWILDITKDAINSNRRNNLRLQLLVLIADYPDLHEEIMTVAEEYFVKLKGNWYLHPVFEKWMAKEGLQRPNWYK